MAKAGKHNTFRLKFNKAGFEAIRNDYRVRADVHDRAERIAGRAATLSGSDTDADDYMVTDLLLEDSRAATSVMAIKSAHHANRERNTLVRALEAGHG